MGHQLSYSFLAISFIAFCRYLPKIFDLYSSAEGFLFLQDNTILNYWNLLEADKTKLWISNEVINFFFSIINFQYLIL